MTMFRKFANNTLETNVSESDNKCKESNYKIEDIFNEDDIDYFDKNTAVNNENSIYVDISDYTADELKELYDDFAGYINGEVRYENSGKGIEDSSLPREYSEEYKQTGIHQVSWSKDSVDGSEQEVTLPVGARIIQYAHEGFAGRYFTNEDTDYSDLQLADSQDKRVIRTYVVAKDFLVTQSIIAKQYFSANEGSETIIQFKSELTADDLVEQGVLINVGTYHYDKP